MHEPQNNDLEQCVLGGILTQPSKYETAAEVLTPNSFYLTGHGDIFRVMGELVERGIEPDSASVMARMKEQGKLDAAGGPMVVLDLLNVVVSGVSVETHSRSVADLALRRAAIRGYTGLIEECYRGELTTDEILFQAGKVTDALSADTSHTDDIVTLESLARASADELAEQCSNGDTVEVTTGIGWLDNMTGGFKPGDLWIWSARPNAGKTRVLLYSLIASAKAGNKMGLISLDMSKQRLMRYALTTVLALTGEPVLASQIFHPITFGPEGEAVIRDECFRIDLGENLLVAPDPRSNSIRAVESIVRQMAQMGCKCVAIDQAQNIREFIPDERGQVADVIGSFKRMGRKFGVSIVLVHQIGRAGSERPKLEHLKDSGCFEEFSDFVVILHDAMKTIHAQHGCYVEEHTGNYRAPKAKEEELDVQHDLQHRRSIEISLAKSRNGETGVKGIWFDYEQGIKT